MKFEDEITVEVNTSYEELRRILENNNFTIKEDYIVKDIYLIDKKYKNEKDNLEKLKHCILIRDIIRENKHKRKITYKYKEYNENKEIIKQGKIDCSIYSTENALELLKTIGYEELIQIEDNIIVWSNETSEFAVQLVNSKHIYIEIEAECGTIDKVYESIDEMKNDIKKYNIPLKSEDYFVKKAEIELKEKN